MLLLTVYTVALVIIELSCECQQQNKRFMANTTEYSNECMVCLSERPDGYKIVIIYMIDNIPVYCHSL